MARKWIRYGSVHFLLDSETAPGPADAMDTLDGPSTFDAPLMSSDRSDVDLSLLLNFEMDLSLSAGIYASTHNFKSKATGMMATLAESLELDAAAMSSSAVWYSETELDSDLVKLDSDFKLALVVDISFGHRVRFKCRYIALRIKFGFVFGSVCKFGPGFELD